MYAAVREHPEIKMKDNEWQKLIIDKNPYILDYLVEIKSNGNEEQRLRANGILSIISD